MHAVGSLGFWHKSSVSNGEWGRFNPFVSATKNFIPTFPNRLIVSVILTLPPTLFGCVNADTRHLKFGSFLEGHSTDYCLLMDNNLS